MFAIFLKNIHFVATKFTKARKEEILKGFRSGMSLSFLAKDFGCTPATITRILKALLGDDGFSELKKANKRLPKDKHLKNINSEEKNNDQNNEFIQDKNSSDSRAADNSIEKETKTSLDDRDGEEAPLNRQSQSEFQELVPLVTNFEWDNQKELACTPFDADSLPGTVFMLVDKSVELESKPLKEFSQWSFLSDKDQNRLAIVLYSNQRSAKRSCSRNQRVLKIPDSSVFQVTLPHLISKGITRLILDDSLISIDN